MAIINGTPGNDTLLGTDGNDTISGLAGNDTLIDRSFFDDPVLPNPPPDTDTLIGGAGDDTFDIRGGNGDVVVENAGEGIDTVLSDGNFTLPANVENLHLRYFPDPDFGGTFGAGGNGNDLNNQIFGAENNDFLNGNDGDDTLFGEGGDDVLRGGAGNDTLDGGASVDLMEGGLGNDIFFVNDDIEDVRENAGEGIDEVRATALAYGLGANLENLTFVGTGDFSGTGNELANRLVGGAGNDTLNGAAGADTMDGGLGADTMVGGTDDDTYIVDTALDVVTENAGEGTDTIQTTLLSYALGSNLENLTFTGIGDFSGTGNGLANRLVGGAGADTLVGGGGVDTMLGSLGDDIFFVDDAADVTTEHAGEGIDEVVATSSTYWLRGNLENLTFVGTGAFSGTGNPLANILTSGVGNDLLNGSIGADVMRGGTGSDGYFIDDSHDVVDETTGDGVDKVHGGVSINLANTARFLGDVENLVLRGTSNLTGSGNALDNVIAGNGGDNVLRGAAGNDYLMGMGGNDQLVGGTGADRLIGGDGVDSFGFVGIADSTVAGPGRDTINDFSHGQGDKIDLSAIDAQSLVVGNQAFAFIGSAAFSRQAGELRIEATGPNLLVSGDVNGNGIADFAILLRGVATADATDFVL